MATASTRRQLIDLIESLPDTTSETGGDADQHVGFTVRKKRFAWYLEDHHDDGVIALTCKAPAGVNTQLATAEPERFFIPSYTGKRGWLGVRLDVGTVDWDEIARLIEDAYRLTAPSGTSNRSDLHVGARPPARECAPVSRERLPQSAS